jgi:hypothetical protein
MDAENTFGRVEKDAVILERCKEGTEVLLVFMGGTSEDEDVVEIGEISRFFRMSSMKRWKV